MRLRACRKKISILYTALLSTFSVVDNPSPSPAGACIPSAVDSALSSFIVHPWWLTGVAGFILQAREGFRGRKSSKTICTTLVRVIVSRCRSLPCCAFVGLQIRCGTVPETPTVQCNTQMDYSLELHVTLETESLIPLSFGRICWRLHRAFTQEQTSYSSTDFSFWLHSLIGDRTDLLGFWNLVGSTYRAALIRNPGISMLHC